jgi:Mg2+ and Co2+ transporter CorA
LQGNRRFKQWHQLFHEDMAFQQIENLCEEQIETLQEFRDELVDNYHHVMGEHKHKNQDILLVRLNDLMSHVERVQKHTLRLRNAIQSAIDLHFSAIANQTNENMRILAIITAIFAPLTLLTGFME